MVPYLLNSSEENLRKKQNFQTLVARTVSYCMPIVVNAQFRNLGDGTQTANRVLAVMSLDSGLGGRCRHDLQWLRCIRSRRRTRDDW